VTHDDLTEAEQTCARIAQAQGELDDLTERLRRKGDALRVSRLRLAQDQIDRALHDIRQVFA
jgi:hypothetical protein